MPEPYETVQDIIDHEVNGSEIAMPICAIRMVKIIDANGDQQIRFRTEGDLDVLDAIQMMEFVKLSIFAVGGSH